MDQFANDLIDTFGGTSAVARHLEAPTSTVHSWRQIGIPASRLAHLKLVAQIEGIAVDWATGREPDEGVDGSMGDGNTPSDIDPSPDNGGDLIGASAAREARAA